MVLLPLCDVAHPFQGIVVPVLDRIPALIQLRGATNSDQSAN